MRWHAPVRGIEYRNGSTKGGAETRQAIEARLAACSFKAEV